MASDPFFQGGDAGPYDGLEPFGDAWAGASTSVALLEERIATLEGGSAALAIAADHAATIIACHTLLQAGDEFVASRGLPRRSNDLFTHTFPGFAWQARWADPQRPESFVEALSDKTKAIIVESIGETGAVTDIEAIANVARRARVPLVVDNTLATPYLVRPLEHGADILVHATTRSLGAPAVAHGSLIVDGGTFDWLQDDRFPAVSKPRGDERAAIGDRFGNFAFVMACRLRGLRDLGAPLAPLEAALALGGLETLSLRLQRQCDGALAVARHLAAHPSLKRVGYGGLESDPGYELARRYCPRGAGPRLTLDLAGGSDAIERLVRRLRLFSSAGDIGGTRSSVGALAAAHGRSGEPQDARVGLTIGLEEVADIIADLDQALAG